MSMTFTSTTPFCTSSQLLQQGHEFLYCQVSVTQDFAQQPWFDSLVVGHGQGKMIWVTFISKADVASPLPHDVIANALQGSDYLAT